VSGTEFPGSGGGGVGGDGSGDGQSGGGGSPFPTPATSFVCDGCSLVPKEIQIAAGSSGSQTATLVDETGNVQGVISVPDSVLQGEGSVSVSSASLPPGTDVSNVGSVVVNVTLLDSQGNEVTQLDSSVELCLQTQQSSDKVTQRNIKNTKQVPMHI
jgi:hypothetical protein